MDPGAARAAAEPALLPARRGALPGGVPAARQRRPGRRPELARQEMRWALVGAAACLALPGRRRMLAWWALTCLMLDWHLGMFETDDGRHRPLGPADALTLTRAWLAPAVLEAPGRRWPPPASRPTRSTASRRDPSASRPARDATSRAWPTPASRRRCWPGCAAAARSAGRLRRRAGAPGRGVLVFAGGLLRAGRGPRTGRSPGQPVRPPSSRAGGLIAAAAGRRRLGTALVAAGCAASVALVGRALRA